MAQLETGTEATAGHAQAAHGGGSGYEFTPSLSPAALSLPLGLSQGRPHGQAADSGALFQPHAGVALPGSGPSHSHPVDKETTVQLWALPRASSCPSGLFILSPRTPGLEDINKDECDGISRSKYWEEAGERGRVLTCVLNAVSKFSTAWWPKARIPLPGCVFPRKWPQLPLP